jgi:hypothetical protein
VSALASGGAGPRRFAWAASVLLAALAVPGCESVAPLRDIRATFADENGRPIPGAILYAEAVDDDGAFAFTWAKAGDAGEVPRIAIRALKIPWRRGARLSIAGFAPGHRPQVLHYPRRSVPSDGVSLTLPSAAQPEGGWNPDLLLLEFPFERMAVLADTLAAPDHRELREAFRAAYEARPSSPPPASAREAEKIEAARKMLSIP